MNNKLKVSDLIAEFLEEKNIMNKEVQMVAMVVKVEISSLKEIKV